MISASGLAFPGRSGRTMFGGLRDPPARDGHPQSNSRTAQEAGMDVGAIVRGGSSRRFSWFRHSRRPEWPARPTVPSGTAGVRKVGPDAPTPKRTAEPKARTRPRDDRAADGSPSATARKSSARSRTIRLAASCISWSDANGPRPTSPKPRRGGRRRRPGKLRSPSPGVGSDSKNGSVTGAPTTPPRTASATGSTGNWRVCGKPRAPRRSCL